MQWPWVPSGNLQLLETEAVTAEKILVGSIYVCSRDWSVIVCRLKVIERFDDDTQLISTI